MAKREKRQSARNRRREEVGRQSFNAPQGAGRATEDEEGFGHVSVLLQEAIQFLNIETRSGGTFLDATVGLGGHSAAMARRLGPEGRLICLDRDPNALNIARQRLEAVRSEIKDRAPAIEFHHAPFSRVREFVAERSVDGMLADLGVSSIQLDDARRGFSFRVEGPLDMRMDPTAENSAQQVVNHIDESDLANVIYEFGEERRSRRIARAIVRARPIRTTAELAEIVSGALGHMKHRPNRPTDVRGARSGKRQIHPATKTFQAIRMFVNRELEEIEALLESAPKLLKPGGRLVIISFHSLEDRIVKDHMRAMAQQGMYEVLTKKPITASEQELDRNPRARSAKLRSAELKRSIGAAQR